ncbi:hypothetical protein A7734_25725 [Salmonella enterica]|nr:hypothetical protein [Salmonella enterica]EBA5002418.1 hypothetical protein [Salmonella enterica]EBQ2501168.1 hypothetical protein [Salmonella enterica]EBQ2501587.1 hypothetical protein [Salmonella enterica]
MRPPILWATHSVVAAFPFAIGDVIFILRSPQLTQYFSPRFYVSTSKSIIKALINMHSFEIQLSPIG